MPKCECGNETTHEGGMCDSCEAIEYEPQHVGHWSRLGGTWWCDTCNSPLCDLL